MHERLEDRVGRFLARDPPFLHVLGVLRVEFEALDRLGDVLGEEGLVEGVGLDLGVVGFRIGRGVDVDVQVVVELGGPITKELSSSTNQRRTKRRWKGRTGE